MIIKSSGKFLDSIISDLRILRQRTDEKKLINRYLGLELVELIRGARTLQIKSLGKNDFVFKMTALLGIVLSLSVLIPLAIHELFPITP